MNLDIFTGAERAGSHSLRMLADPLSVEILRGAGSIVEGLHARLFADEAPGG